jgi:hypothetical protein
LLIVNLFVEFRQVLFGGIETSLELFRGRIFFSQCQVVRSKLLFPSRNVVFDLFDEALFLGVGRTRHRAGPAVACGSLHASPQGVV